MTNIEINKFQSETFLWVIMVMVLDLKDGNAVAYYIRIINTFHLAYIL